MNYNPKKPKPDGGTCSMVAYQEQLKAYSADQPKHKKRIGPHRRKARKAGRRDSH